MKVIPITPLGNAPAGSCGDDSGEVPTLKLPLTRRSLLRGSGLLLGTLAAGSTLSLLAPSRAWALELKTLNSAEGTTLMKMGRVLFPHSKLPDAVYALLAKDLDAGSEQGSGHGNAATRRHRRAEQGGRRQFRQGLRRKAAGGGEGAGRHAVFRRGARPVRHLAVRQRHGLRGLRLSRLGLGKRRLHHARFPGPEVAASAFKRSQPASLHGLRPFQPRPNTTHRKNQDITWQNSTTATTRVVVIIGSGAGGGTLANELCQKGIKVVVLEAGAMQSNASFINDEWKSFSQLAWLDNAHHLGQLARREGLPEPAGLDLQDRGRHHHALGRRLAAPAGARVQSAKHITARSRAPTCWTGRSRCRSWSPTTPRPKTRWA